MRRAHAPNGIKLFTPSEYVNKGQIRSLFERLSKRRETMTATNKTAKCQPKEDDISSDGSRAGTFDECSSEASNDDQDDYFDLEQEQTMESLISEEVEYVLGIWQEPGDTSNVRDMSNK
jgi:hypothetical protein